MDVSSRSSRRRGFAQKRSKPKVPVAEVAIAVTGLSVAQGKRDRGQDVTGAQKRLSRVISSEELV